MIIYDDIINDNVFLNLLDIFFIQNYFNVMKVQFVINSTTSYLF